MAASQRLPLAAAGFAVAHLLSAGLFARLPEAPHALGPLIGYLLLVPAAAAALHPFIQLRTAWFYLVILAPTFLELALLVSLGPENPWLQALLDLAILAYAWCFGKLFAKGIPRAGLLLVLLFLVAAADVLSVYGGPARRIYESVYVKVFVLNWPAPGGGVEYVLGFGDMMLYVLLLAWCQRNGLPLPRTVRALLATFAVVGFAAWAGGVVLPALPFLCLSFLGAHLDRFRLVRLTHADRRLLGFGLAALCGAALLFRWIG